MFAEIVSQIKDGLPSRIRDEYDNWYVRDKRACNTMNKVLETNYKAVYRCLREYEQSQLSSKELHIDTGYTFVVTSKDRILFMSNSEWMSIKDLK
jgi:hypothetical protein